MQTHVVAETFSDISGIIQIIVVVEKEFHIIHVE